MSKVELVMLMCTAQFALVFFKHLNVRIIVAEHVFKSVFMTLAIQATWLVSTAIGVKAVWDGDVLVVIAYLLSGMLGAYFNFKIKI